MLFYTYIVGNAEEIQIHFTGKGRIEMYEVELNMYQAAAVAAVVLLLGKAMIKKIPLLSKYCIPEPVAGGVVFAVLHTLLRSVGILEVSFDGTLQTFFMMLFYCTAGFTASFRLLKKGGIQVMLFLALAGIMCILQDGTGSAIAGSFGLDPRLGLAAGSIPLVGGHGTAGSFGPALEEAGVFGANAVAIASATFGLVAGCVIGGPIAYRRIRQFHLESGEKAAALADLQSPEKERKLLDSGRFLDAALLLAITVGLGTVLAVFLNMLMTFPTYMGPLVMGAIMRNVLDGFKSDIPTDEISTIGGMSLSLYLGLAMMSLKLWQLAALAVPMVVMLLAQTVLTALFAYFIVFHMLGRNYDAAVMTTGFCGFGMGATPNAMANMQAVTSQYGPAPTAFFVVPIVGSLFIDVVNSLIITVFMNILH